MRLYHSPFAPNARRVRMFLAEKGLELPLVQQLMHLNRQTKPIGVDYFCDAAVLAQGGIPSIVFGPGDIAQAHTGDEWISLSSLERGGAGGEREHKKKQKKRLLSV